MHYRIPFNRPRVPRSTYQHVHAALVGRKFSGDGPFTHQCRALLEKTLPGSSVLLTTSCTHALEMCAFLVHVEPGDEIIFPTFTFVSTVNAFVIRGARPIFVDSRPDTLNIDEAKIVERLTPRTKAIVAVHYAGVACALDRLLSIARAYNVSLVEDNAHGLAGRFRGQPLGTFGCLATLSFHETKNFSCGEGGALLVNAAELYPRAEIIREKGTNRSRFFRGQVDRYTWVDVGSSYLISDVLAALLYAQLEDWSAIQARRTEIWNHYYHALKPWASHFNVRLPIVPGECEHPGHLFYLLLPSIDDRDELIAHLKERGICSTFHYLPLHCSTFGATFGYQFGDCPVAEAASDRLMRLPLFPDLTDDEVNEVIGAVQQFQPRYRAAQVFFESTIQLHRNKPMKDVA